MSFSGSMQQRQAEPVLAAAKLCEQRNRNRIALCRLDLSRLPERHTFPIAIARGLERRPTEGQMKSPAG
jgi:hypothetical protein